MSDRMASRGTRSSVPEEVPSKARGDARYWDELAAIFHDMFFRGKLISGVQHVNEVAAGMGHGTVTAN